MSCNVTDRIIAQIAQNQEVEDENLKHAQECSSCFRAVTELAKRSGKAGLTLTPIVIIGVIAIIIVMLLRGPSAPSPANVVPQIDALRNEVAHVHSDLERMAKIEGHELHPKATAKEPRRTPADTERNLHLALRCLLLKEHAALNVSPSGYQEAVKKRSGIALLEDTKLLSERPGSLSPSRHLDEMGFVQRLLGVENQRLAKADYKALERAIFAPETITPDSFSRLKTLLSK